MRSPLPLRPVSAALCPALLLSAACAVAIGLHPLAADIAAAGQATSRIRVTMPQEEAELLVNDNAVAGAGTSREFQSPPLEPGRTYEYKFTAKWRPNGYTVIIRHKTVRFTGGDTTTVDLTTDDPNDRAEVRYVPTSSSVVQEMVAFAGLRNNDVVYEPGCGDARMTIAAVKAGAARGVGIDLDPARVAESRANVKAAGLDDRIEIRLGDALDIKDLSEATVVFLYMGDEFDMLIRPILWRQLKVGTRIVSHRFTMGDWPPDKTIVVSDNDNEEYATLHLWTVTKEVKERSGKN